uniref:Protein GPR108-like isoform X2 n=1 Tax=Crassostrea virginica TaxID=6565 RepID=A0A8B8D0D6_CRAVI|nr:protein GPR108-like isoform X2 [Crassostrea virginica]
MLMDSNFPSPNSHLTDALNSHGHHSNLLSDAPKCVRCTHSIFDPTLVSFGENFWHRSCFRCMVCHRELDDACFSNGKEIYCTDDFTRLYRSNCAGCSENLTPSEIVRRVFGSVYHETCFKCILCDRALQTGDRVYLRDDNKLICEEDYANLHGQDEQDCDPNPENNTSLNDDRGVVRLSTFGFLKKGALQVKINQLRYNVGNLNATDFDLMYGFTLDKSKSSGVASYLEDNQDKNCILSMNNPSSIFKDRTMSIIFFKLRFSKKMMEIQKYGEDITLLEISEHAHMKTSRRTFITNGNTGKTFSDSVMMHKPSNNKFTDPVPKSGQQDKKSGAGKKSGNRKRRVLKDPPPKVEVPQTTTPKRVVDPRHPDPIPIQGDLKNGYSVSFGINVETDQEEGLYNLYFHNCFQYIKNVHSTFEMQINIEERNDDNYLSAGDIPIPILFFILSIVFFIAGIIWMVILRRVKEDVYTMHYLMFAVVMVKALSNLFNAVNMHFIAVEGMHEEAWAILYYIVYLSRGALLFVTILLIGTGWTFVKHVFSDKEKKLFLIVIPLQILDNIAYIIIEESEEGQSEYAIWQQIFILVDLMCCGAILFPVVWSMRHLQQSTRTDGKAALSLQKLALFRHFYTMIVCYIYFTRIIVYLVKITVPFQYEWLDELFKELATLVFFVITGYKFQPAPDNPYLQVPTEEDEDEEVEMEEVVTKSGAMDTVTHVNKGTSGLKQRESSHEYD